MQEHPIPQDVTGYKFHIVGNMTLKQFAEVGAGVLVGVILYNTNLLPFIKWPLIAFSVGLGAMMAFVPIEERPLDHWIVTFFRRLYSPTKFYWRKESEVPFALQPEKLQKSVEAPPMEVDLTPARQQRIREYIQSVKNLDETEPWEASQNERINDIMTTFDQVTVDTVTPKPQAVKPQLTPRIRKLSPSQKPPAEKQVVFEAPAAPTPAEPVGAVVTNAKLPFPERELAPNKLMGMVLTKDNKLVDRAVVSLKNPQGAVIQSMRTNVLGQFSSPNILANGTYAVAVKKEGLSFPEKTLTVSGGVLQPLELRAA